MKVLGAYIYSNLDWFWAEKCENPTEVVEYWSDVVVGIVAQKNNLIRFD